MATMILLPNGSNNVSSDWEPVGAGSVQNALMYDDGATAYVKCDDITERMTIEFANPSVAEGDIDISAGMSVRFLSSGKANHRSSSTRISVEFYAPPGNPAEDANYLAHRSNFTTINGTARPYSNGLGSADWTYANLEDLEMRVTMSSVIEVYFSYLAMEVTYTPAAAADNATFFGANF